MSAQRSRSPRLLWLGAGIALLLAVMLGISGQVAAQLVKTRLTASLKRSCPACSLEIGELQISLFTGRIRVDEIRYSGDPKEDSTLRFSAERLEARVNPLSLLRHQPQIESIDAIQPVVTIREKADTPPGAHALFPSPGSAFKSFPAAQVDHVRVYGGKFNYELDNHGRVGKIELSQINGNVSRFATRERLLTEKYRQPILMVATARLEQSGSVKFRVSFDPFADKNHDSIDLELRGQKMEELNPFFTVESGLSLSGVLKQGKAELVVSQGHLSGTLSGSYEDLKLKFQPTPERGKIKSKVTTMISSIETAKTRPKPQEKQPPEAQVSAQREPREPITKFLIRGLRDAAKKVLTS
jgi:hypothetical protein